MRCAGCGEVPARGKSFCDACWASVPAGARKLVERTAQALGKRPTSAQLRAEWQDAIATAAGYVA